jgi:hypothetical protein
VLYAEASGTDKGYVPKGNLKPVDPEYSEKEFSKENSDEEAQSL